MSGSSVIGLAPAYLAASVFALGLWCTSGASQAADVGYVVAKGDQNSCRAFLEKRVEQLKPAVLKASPAWAEHRGNCPALLAKKKRGKGPAVESDDYALYEVDIDNDGLRDTVLYVRNDYDYQTTSVLGGQEGRRVAGVETVEEFHIVDLRSCNSEPVFVEFGKSDLVRMNGETYIRNVNPQDSAKTMSFYKKSKGIPLAGSYEDDVCRFSRAPEVKTRR